MCRVRDKLRTNRAVTKSRKRKKNDEEEEDGKKRNTPNEQEIYGVQMGCEVWMNCYIILGTAKAHFLALALPREQYASECLRGLQTLYCVFM